MSAIGMQQAMIVGTFFDGQTQLETQRLFNQLENEAHRDYLPTQDFCMFGTNVRSLAATEAQSRYYSLAMDARSMARHMGSANQVASSPDNDKRARWDVFTEKYCDPQDNNWRANSASVPTGLQGVCQGTGGDNERVNIDIDYTRLIDNPRTLDVTFNGSEDQEDVFALASNLYGHDVLKRDMELDSDAYQTLYMALRSVAARRNVAENSLNAIVEMKSAGSSDMAGEEATGTREFLAAILTEMGVSPSEVYEYIGERPSYYAQLEILAKTIYQNPDFYANLYDKPANVARKGVALKAIELMLDRAIYESQLRREMATSVLLSTKLRGEVEAANEKLREGGS